MRIEHVQALEAGDFDAFVAPVYLRGFVRAYARFVKLDETSLLNQLDRELAALAKSSQPPPLPATTPDPLGALVERLRGIRLRASLPILAGILLAAGGWAFVRSWMGTAKSTPSASPTTGMYQSSTPDPADVLPLPDTAAETR